MENLLDNPVYHAMMNGNRNLTMGSETVRYFPAEISPFVGLKDYGAAAFAELAELLPRGQVAAVVSPEKIKIPGKWKIIHYGLGLQMMWDAAAGRGTAVGRGPEFVPLERVHVPQMVQLAKLTNPGPFGERTIEFGHFTGLFDGDRLVAMSGHRLHPTPYIEISGVCTHPDYAGRGYGGALTLYQVQNIREAEEIPILHVWANNDRAIRMYEHLGFVTRRELHFTIIRLKG